jgi:hypothetical protein
VDRDSSVGIATRYELEGAGIESRCGRYFPHPSRTALEPTHPYTMGNGSFSGVTWPEPGADLPLSSAEVKERVELYL